MFNLPFLGRQPVTECPPGDGQVEIKSAAILHVDIVGSTRLVQENLRLAHRQIRHLYGRICRLSSAHNGVARELRGDAAVVEFESATDALRATLAIHSAHAMIDNTRLGRINPELRTGLSFGPVISEENMITGEAVIRAQRLEQLAEPGQVLIDEPMRDALGSSPDFDLEPWGACQLKGFDTVSKIYVANRHNAASLETLSRHFQSLAVPRNALLAKRE